LAIAVAEFLAGRMTFQLVNKQHKSVNTGCFSAKYHIYNRKMQEAITERSI